MVGAEEVSRCGAMALLTILTATAPEPGVHSNEPSEPSASTTHPGDAHE